MSGTSLCTSSEKSMESTSGSQPSEQADRNVVGLNTVSAHVERNYSIASSLQRGQTQEEEDVEMCERGRDNDGNNNTERSRGNISFHISEPRRKKFATVCCMFGVIGIATGTGLILIYLIGEYTPVFGEMSNLEAVSIPGFIFLFIGIFTSVVGIFFCWIYTSENSSRNSREEERQAGFNIPGHRRNCGHDNPALASDLPPSYITVARSRSFIASLSETTDHSFQKPPSYIDATTLKEEEEEDKSNPEENIEDPHSSEPQPPPY